LTESCKNFKEGITSKIKQVLRNYVHLQSSKMSEKEWGKEIRQDAYIEGQILSKQLNYFTAKISIDIGRKSDVFLSVFEFRSQNPPTSWEVGKIEPWGGKRESSNENLKGAVNEGNDKN